MITDNILPKTLANGISKRSWLLCRLFSLGSLTWFLCLEKRQKKTFKNCWQKFLTLISGHHHLELAYNKITQKRSILSILVVLWLFLKSSLRPYEVVEVKGRSSLNFKILTSKIISNPEKCFQTLKCRADLQIYHLLVLAYFYHLGQQTILKFKFNCICYFWPCLLIAIQEYLQRKDK